ncbi:hypothetical protein GGS20DRAFT_593136 [Poronia punctata]|nr:hypothetical protein GGS20DRAFT_593136 [Poronia punctata]
MGGQFTPVDPARCPHYAGFASHLDRTHFDALYWTLFFLVILALFSASWVFQWTMKYRDCATFTVEKFRKRLLTSLICTLGIFLVAAVMIVMEVYALLALQFCDGEDLMSLYWATWTMLQLGSEIAILGVSLALWHHLQDMEHPLWALALGTPVLVVAGFGHVLWLVIRRFYLRFKGGRKARCYTCSKEACVESRDISSSSTSVEKTQEEEDEEQQQQEKLYEFETGRTMYLAMDTGNDERVRQWPCFMYMADGKAVVRVTTVSGPGPSMTRQESSETLSG